MPTFLCNSSLPHPRNVRILRSILKKQSYLNEKQNKVALDRTVATSPVFRSKKLFDASLMIKKNKPNSQSHSLFHHFHFTHRSRSDE